MAWGYTHPDHPMPVVNERQARAGAGILLVLALIAFQTAFTSGDFTLTRLAILGFGVDFALRVAFGPGYAPSLILGGWMVRHQQPDWVAAAPKRFAWALGLAIALVMAVWIMGLNMAGPVAILGCLSCLILLFFESAFGICVGCKLHARVWPEAARLCPGGVCQPRAPLPRLAPLPLQAGIVALVLAGVVMAAPSLSGMPQPDMPGMAHQAGGPAPKDCTVPEFAKAIGHEQMWKMHNGCL